MNFQPELAQKVLRGEKTVTRRLVSDNPCSPWAKGGCSLAIGRTYAVCPGRGKHAIGRVRIKDVRMEMLGNITDEEARAEGFDSIPAFFDAFRGINGAPINGWTYVWRVEFELTAAHPNRTGNGIQPRPPKRNPISKDVAPAPSPTPLTNVSSSKVSCESCGREVWVELAVALADPPPSVVCQTCLAAPRVQIVEVPCACGSTVVSAPPVAYCLGCGLRRPEHDEEEG